MYIFYRVKAYINYGWYKNIVNPYDSAQSSLSGQDVTVSELNIPSDGWKPIKEAFLTTDIPKFNNGHIVTYFALIVL